MRCLSRATICFIRKRSHHSSFLICFNFKLQGIVFRRTSFVSLVVKNAIKSAIFVLVSSSLKKQGRGDTVKTLKLTIIHKVFSHQEIILSLLDYF